MFFTRKNAVFMRLLAFRKRLSLFKKERSIMSVNKELVKGSTSMLVLGVLEEKEMYGYQIIKELEQRSETVFSLKEGTLYPILHVLEQDGFLEAYWEDTSSARKRRFYRITKKGRKELDRQKEEWKEYAGAVGKVLQLQNA